MGIIMGNIIAIYRKELQGYFASPFAYVIAGVFWLLSGFFFVIELLGPNGILAAVAYRDQVGITEPPIDVPYQLLSNFLSIVGLLTLFILPMLSMGLYTEERKRGTLELLATSPITNWAVAVGKLLGVLTFFLTMMLPLVAYEAIALSAASPPIQPTVVLLGHLGLFLMAASILSLGMFISSLTDSTILAAILTFSLMLFLWVSSSIGGPVGDALKYVSLLKNYGDLIQGILDTSGLVLFASYIFLGLFLTAQSIEAFRFQRS
jgi:ABC-2 type transport system permease protein